MLAGLVDRKVADRQIFAVSWLDVDDFGAINDSGGFTAGDDLIRELGRALTSAAGTVGSAEVAHIGGDDFVVVCELDDVLTFGSAVLDQPREAGGREVALSLASLVCAPGMVAGHRDVSRMLAQLRRRAKAMPGTSWVLGRPGSDQVDVVRGPMELVNGVEIAGPRECPGSGIGRAAARGAWLPADRGTG